MASLRGDVPRGPGESAPGLAIRRSGEAQTGESGQVSAGRIAVEDLQDEQMDRRDRIEYSIPPAMVDLRTDIPNRTW